MVWSEKTITLGFSDHKNWKALNSSLTFPRAALFFVFLAYLHSIGNVIRYDLPEEYHSLMIKEGKNQRKMLETI